MNMSTQVDQSSLQTDAGTDQYLTFILADEEYGVDIMKVQEIRGWDGATAIPNTPDYILGVSNLRGMVVPIIDLRQRFHLTNAEFNSSTVVVIVKVVSESGERTVGLVVDAVSEVYNLPEEVIGEAPDLGGAISTNFIKGLATMDEKMIILLDIDPLINSGVLQELEQATKP
jgi:purine-binding chemotaxis protein CheW